VEKDIYNDSTYEYNMRKNKAKPVSYKAIKNNRTLSEFVKEEVIDKTKEITKITWDLVMKMTKKK